MPRLVEAISSSNLWFSRDNDCIAGLLEKIVTGDLLLGRLRECSLISLKYEGGFGAILDVEGR